MGIIFTRLREETQAHAHVQTFHKPASQEARSKGWCPKEPRSESKAAPDNGIWSSMQSLRKAGGSPRTSSHLQVSIWDFPKIGTFIQYSK